MRNFAENLNLGNRFRPPLSKRVLDLAFAKTYHKSKDEKTINRS